MKKVYVMMFIGIIAIALVAVSILTYDPKVEQWTSVLAGAAFAFFLIKLPALIAYYKRKRKA